MIKLHKNVALSDSGYVFDPSTGESYTLNPIGLEVVKMLKENKPDDEIQSRILERYEVDASTLERYYMDFIGMLLNYQLADNE
ncbi:MAG: PqqD family protein [Mangrovibacterium sp.]